MMQRSYKSRYEFERDERIKLIRLLKSTGDERDAYKQMNEAERMTRDGLLRDYNAIKLRFKRTVRALTKVMVQP